WSHCSMSAAGATKEARKARGNMLPSVVGGKWLGGVGDGGRRTQVRVASVGGGGVREGLGGREEEPGQGMPPAARAKGMQRPSRMRLVRSFIGWVGWGIRLARSLAWGDSWFVTKP